MDWIKNAVMKFWVATAAGLLAAILQIVVPIFKDGRYPTKYEWAYAVSFALAGICTRFVTPEDKKDIKLSVVFFLIGMGLLMSPCLANAQTWKDGDSVKVAWDAEAGAKLYKIYKRPFGGGAESFVMDVLTGTSATVRIPEAGRWILGVSTVATVGGVDVESTGKCWSDDASCTFQGQTFGLRNLPPPSHPKNFRKNE